MAIDKDGPVAPYRQIAVILRNQIESGELPAGSKISEYKLAKTHEVSRMTVRHALESLRADGLIYTVPSRGSYVGSAPS